MPDLSAIYDRLGARLFRHALAWTRCRASAEDAVHAAFAKLLQSRTAPRDVDAYLHVAVRREASRLETRTGRTTSLDAVDDPLVEPRPGAALESAEAVRRALALLPPDQREVVVLHVFEELTFARIAELCAVSPNTVAARYRYARRRLEEELRVPAR